MKKFAFLLGPAILVAGLATLLACSGKSPTQAPLPEPPTVVTPTPTPTPPPGTEESTISAASTKVEPAPPGASYWYRVSIAGAGPYWAPGTRASVGITCPDPSRGDGVYTGSRVEVDLPQSMVVDLPLPSVRACGDECELEILSFSTQIPSGKSKEGVDKLTTVRVKVPCG